jgi:hypothetical protein
VEAHVKALFLAQTMAVAVFVAPLSYASGAPAQAPAGRGFQGRWHSGESANQRFAGLQQKPNGTGRSFGYTIMHKSDGAGGHVSTGSGGYFGKRFTVWSGGETHIDANNNKSSEVHSFASRRGFILKRNTEVVGFQTTRAPIINEDGSSTVISAVSHNVEGHNFISGLPKNSTSVKQTFTTTNLDLSTHKIEVKRATSDKFGFFSGKKKSTTKVEVIETITDATGKVTSQRKATLARPAEGPDAEYLNSFLEYGLREMPEASNVRMAPDSWQAPAPEAPEAPAVPAAVPVVAPRPVARAIAAAPRDPGRRNLVHADDPKNLTTVVTPTPMSPADAAKLKAWQEKRLNSDRSLSGK